MNGARILEMLFAAPARAFGDAWSRNSVTRS